MGEGVSLEELRGEAWFPSGIAQSIEPAAEQTPEGFEAWRLHTRFDSHLLLLPVGDVDSINWWMRVIPVGGGGTRWGDPPQFDGGKIEKLSARNEGAGWSFLLTEKSGRKVIIRVLPYDEKGHGRTLAELGSEHLHTAFGGLQVGDHDLLLFFRQEIGERADQLLVAALANQGKPTPVEAGEEADQLLAEVLKGAGFQSEDLSEGQKICFSVGAVLGRFHRDALAAKALPNDERKWNDRLKILEERTYSNTLWRGPHSVDTQATITHRNFGLEAVWFNDETFSEAVISCCHDGIPNAILPKSRDFPAVRDLAAAYRSLAAICTKQNVSGEDELNLRKALFEGWCSSAPGIVTSSRALDGHRGGVAIWEYEQVLEEVAVAQAWGGEVDPRTTWWLGHVNRIQDQMYRSRTLSALSLLSGSAAFLSLFTEQWVPNFGSRIGASIVLAGLTFALRWLYRRRAPPPY